MTDSRDTIKEFLIRIGIDVDEAKVRNALANMEKVSLELTAMAAAAVAAAAAVTKAVASTASSFEKLYYQSQRTGTSANNLKALGFAASQLGSSVEEAGAAVENLSKKFRDSPGYAAQLKALGVDMSGDNAARLVSFMDRLAQMPAMRRNAYLQAYGFDEKLFYAIENPQFRKEFDGYLKRLKEAGLNADNAGKGGARFMQSIRGLGTELRTIWDAAAEKIFEQYGDVFKDLDDYLRAHAKEIAEAIAKIVGKILKLVRAIVKALPKIDDFVERIGGWNVALGALAAVLAARVLPGLARLSALLVELVGIQMPAWFLAMLGIPGILAGGLFFGSTTGLNEGEDELGRQRDIARGGNGIPKDGRTWWQRTMPKWLGGKDAPGFGDGSHVSSGGPAGGPRNSYFTKENADALRATAARLGTTPEDLATVIGYETGGRFSPSIWGGKGGNYMGLIQFGPTERQKYGASQDQTFAEQLGAVERYLKDRGFKPGMGILDLYSTINAGRPGRYGASDGNGTVRSHVARMIAERSAQARAFLASGGSQLAWPNLPSFVGPANAAEALRNPFGNLPSRDLFKTAPIGAPSVSNSWKTSSTTYAPTQTVTVHVDGAASPTDTANAVAGNLRRAGSDLVRNMTPVAA